MNSRKRKKISPESYQERTYRKNITADGLVSSYVSVKETDLHILASGNTEKDCYDSVHRYRNQLENYIRAHPDFLTSLIPLEPRHVGSTHNQGYAAGGNSCKRRTHGCSGRRHS